MAKIYLFTIALLLLLGCSGNVEEKLRGKEKDALFFAYNSVREHLHNPNKASYWKPKVNAYKGGGVYHIEGEVDDFRAGDSTFIKRTYDATVKYNGKEGSRQKENWELLEYHLDNK